MRTRLAILMLLCGGLAFQPVFALPPWMRQDSRQGLPSGWVPQARESENRRSPQEAARRAQEMNGGGRVLAVEPAGNGYRVKLLKDGEVRVVYVQ